MPVACLIGSLLKHEELAEAQLVHLPGKPQRRAYA